MHYKYLDSKLTSDNSIEIRQRITIAKNDFAEQSKIGILTRNPQTILSNLMYRVFRYTAGTHRQLAFKLKQIRNYGNVNIEMNIPYK